MKTIWIFTNEDNPCYGNEEEKKHLIVCANDVVDNGVDIYAWPLPRLSSITFDWSVLFNCITTKDSYTDETSLLLRKENVPFTTLDDILSLIQQQWKKSRRSFSVPLLFPGYEERVNDPGIQLDFFLPVSIQRMPGYVMVHQESTK